MQIAQITPTFPPYQAGTGNVCFAYAKELGNRGHQVTVFTSAYPPGKYSYPPEFFIRRLPAFFRLGNAPFLPGLLGLRNFDIIHLHFPFIFGAEMIYYVCKKYHIPYVITHHNDLIATDYRRYLFDIYTKFVIPISINGSNKITVVSLDHALNGRSKKVFLNNKDRLVEIPNGVDANAFRPTTNGYLFRQSQNIPENAVVSLFVGALDPAHHYKRVDILLKAFESLKQNNTYLVLIGGGKGLDFFKIMAQNLGISNQVRFLGSIPNNELPNIYNASDIFVLPSYIQEAAPLVVIEAMSCGKPVIVSNLPGVRSLVTNGVDGFVVEPGVVNELASKMNILINNPHLRSEFGSQGRKKVEKSHTWPKIVDKLEVLYRNILTSSG